MPQHRIGIPRNDEDVEIILGKHVFAMKMRWHWKRVAMAVELIGLSVAGVGAESFAVGSSAS